PQLEWDFAVKVSQLEWDFAVKVSQLEWDFAVKVPQLEWDFAVKVSQLEWDFVVKVPQLEWDFAVIFFWMVNTPFEPEMGSFVKRFEEVLTNDEGRSARNYATIAWIAMKLLDMAGRGEKEAFWTSVVEKIVPQYATMQQHAGVPGTSSGHQARGSPSDWLKYVFAVLQTIEQYSRWLTHEFGHVARDCEEAMAFHVDSL
ncbi:hypothetical protein Bbelb_283980, partial [Branchiostoma belcheri]